MAGWWPDSHVQASIGSNEQSLGELVQVEVQVKVDVKVNSDKCVPDRSVEHLLGDLGDVGDVGDVEKGGEFPRVRAVLCDI